MDLPDLWAELDRHIATASGAERIGLLIGLSVRVEQLGTLARATMPDRLLTQDQAAALLGVSRRWLLARTKGLPFRTAPTRKKLRFQETALRAWFVGLDKMRNVATSTHSGSDVSLRVVTGAETDGERA